jgi:hypothetical protein
MRKPGVVRLIGTLVTAACAGGGTGENPRGIANDTVAIGDSGGGMGNVPTGQDMAGMAGMQMDTMMDARMQAHMQAMQGTTGDSLRRMMPMHRQMADSLMAQVRQQMHRMPSGGGAAWQALADSVQQDMRRMEHMSGTELQTFLSEHQARVMRLMQAHRGMMKSTP